MKVAVVAFNNLKFSPYIYPYVNILTKIGAEIEIIYPDRLSLNEEFPHGKRIGIEWDSSKSKVFNFFVFQRKATRVLRKNKYDFVIVLTTFPSVILSSVLIGHYKGRYLVDVRDYTHEGNRIYYTIEHKVFKNAAMRVISAPGFLNFLPEFDYTLCHNANASYRDSSRRFSKNESGKITIGYVGTITYAEQCKKTIDLVKADDRFTFYFYGNEAGEKPVNRYIAETGCDRIKAFGEYSPDEKSKILEGIDILFNVYGNGIPLLRYALSNKLYDSMYFKKPLLVSPDTDMQRETGEFSYSIDFKEKTNLDGLYNWYRDICPEEFEGFGDEYLKKVFESNDDFEETLVDVLKKIEKKS